MAKRKHTKTQTPAPESIVEALIKRLDTTRKTQREAIAITETANEALAAYAAFHIQDCLDIAYRLLCDVMEVMDDICGPVKADEDDDEGDVC